MEVVVAIAFIRKTLRFIVSSLAINSLTLCNIFLKQVITTCKTELEALLRSFSIYVDNPCCVLTQEDSKKFIHGKPSDKYEFFLKVIIEHLRVLKNLLYTNCISLQATGLKASQADLLASKEYLADTNGEMTEIQVKIEQKTELLKQLEQDLRELSGLEQFALDIEICRAKAFWCDARVLEETIEELEIKLSEVKEKQRSLEKELEDVNVNDDGSVELIEKIKSSIEGLSNEETVIADALGEKTQELSAIKRAKADLVRHAKEADRGVQDATKQLKDLTAKVCSRTVL